MLAIVAPFFFGIVVILGTVAIVGPMIALRYGSTPDRRRLIIIGMYVVAAALLMLWGVIWSHAR
jgi:UPF0716 family protein affecting phage T7 exclusion